ncbi:MAG: hypothetical protein OSJ28_02060 [Desulfovibrio sp.]|nr:hypothetical protein [Desulfovibrio sp.]
MGSFIKGMTFTMEGKEYEVVNEGTNDPASCLVYVLSQEKETADPQTLRMWKAEAKLARGDIMISGYSEESGKQPARDSFYPPVTDPLEQIAELKKRIHAIEQRRISLLKVDDPKAQILLQDNVVRPNKPFDVWNYTKSSGDTSKQNRKIQYVKLRGIMLVITSNSNQVEHFLFNISDQLQPCCRIAGDTLSSEGKIKIDLSAQVQTIQGNKTQILTSELEGRIELAVELKLNCKYATGLTIINAQIVQAAYIRDVNAPGLKINKIAFPEIGNHMIAVEGICVDIYTEGSGDI